MHQETISDKQAIMLVMLFIIGTAIVFIPGFEAGKDVWLASQVGDKRSNNTEESSSFEYLMIALAPWCEKYLSM